ncbi:GNAT family N-acetyltransferase [Litoreibacter albidus]|uniref:GNAT family N-acetyltransferase n=1 Tax=Litoreibacter albidus TaxID=670155 RepID=UPI003735ACB9
MTKTELEIRPYQAEDNAVLTVVWLDASRIAHDFLGAAKLTEQSKLVSDIYLPQAETWVACLDGKPVGFLGLMDNYIGGLFVSPDAQGRGIGQAMIAHGLKLKGTLTLDVYAKNLRTVAFYEKQGFVETDRRPTDKEGLPFEEISMSLSG